MSCRITSQDDGGVIKKIITAGRGLEFPEAGDEVTGESVDVAWVEFLFMAGRKQ